MKTANAEGRILIDSGEYALSRIGAIFTSKPARLKINPVSVEERIELVERQTCRTSGTEKKQIAFCETRLNRRSIQRLKQLRLQQFTDPSNLMARQDRIGICQKPVGREVSWIGVDGLPSFYQRKLLESKIAVDPTET